MFPYKGKDVDDNVKTFKLVKAALIDLTTKSS